MNKGALHLNLGTASPTICRIYYIKQAIKGAEDCSILFI